MPCRETSHLQLPRVARSRPSCISTWLNVPPPPNISHPARSFAQSPPLYLHPMPLYTKSLPPLPLCPITGASSAETRAKTRPTLSHPISSSLANDSPLLPPARGQDRRKAGRAGGHGTHPSREQGEGGGVGRGERRTVTSYNGFSFLLPYHTLPRELNTVPPTPRI